MSGVQLKALFAGVVYVELDWQTAKQLCFFPPVEYLEPIFELSLSLNEVEGAHSKETTPSNHGF